MRQDDHNPEKWYVERCQHCGELWNIHYETHGLEECPDPPPVVSADGCPMCGEEYDDWMSHLQGCSGG